MRLRPRRFGCRAASSVIFSHESSALPSLTRMISVDDGGSARERRSMRRLREPELL
jgi:hypothetical protein